MIGFYGAAHHYEQSFKFKHVSGGIYNSSGKAAQLGEQKGTPNRLYVMTVMSRYDVQDTWAEVHATANGGISNWTLLGTMRLGNYSRYHTWAGYGTLDGNLIVTLYASTPANATYSIVEIDAPSVIETRITRSSTTTALDNYSVTMSTTGPTLGIYTSYGSKAITPTTGYTVLHDTGGTHRIAHIISETGGPVGVSMAGTELGAVRGIRV